MELRKLGMILLLSSVIISGAEKLILMNESADLFRSNINSTANYVSKNYGININATLISSYSLIIVIILAIIEIGLSTLLIKIGKGSSTIPWFLMWVYLFCYSFVYYNPNAVHKTNKSIKDYYERMFFFNILIILGLFIISGTGSSTK